VSKRNREQERGESKLERVENALRRGREGRVGVWGLKRLSKIKTTY